ncbi:D-amino-acid transaminase [Cytobacillus sp. IB215316]|uniref:D-amino-acid transaminase n=1 Tax=Cytobacillus sp. IB215316 TaxID=3097354 RepID=UPI002A10394B|nr:D-amino-acid transaminase [Cytobacillus sp. IB215316]MDX8361904.1 D-amino-acid transaminase [Cytobacillus sp. IB215316]
MEVAFYGDKFIDINEKVVPIQERGHQFGDGIYEVIRVYDGKPFLLKAHLNRLEMSAKEILIDLPFSLEKVNELILEGITRSELKDAQVYIQVTRGIAPRDHIFPKVPAQFSMTVRPSRHVDRVKRQNGVALQSFEDTRWANCFIKSLNLLPNVITKQKASEAGYDEAVFIRNGIVTECSSCNLFAVRDGVAYTHPATNHILHGITREAVINIASQNDLSVKEHPFDIDFLYNADEVFITSTSIEILPVNKIDNMNISMNNPITKQLISAFQQLKEQ